MVPRAAMYWTVVAPVKQASSPSLAIQRKKTLLSAAPSVLLPKQATVPGVDLHPLATVTVKRMKLLSSSTDEAAASTVKMETKPTVVRTRDWRIPATGLVLEVLARRMMNH